MALRNWLARFTNRNLENPATPIDGTTLGALLGARTSAAGVNVNESTALETMPVWAAVRMISSTLATLPLPVYQRVDGGKERAPNHPAYALLHDRWNPELSSFVARELMAAHLLLLGNSFHEIERNGRGDPIALWPIYPGAVRVHRLDNGQKVYGIRTKGVEVPVSADRILHVQGFSLEGHMGLFPVGLARNAIGLTAATEQFGSQFFSNGAAPSGILTHPGKLTEDSEKNLRASWTAANAGLTNAQRVAVLEEGMTWTPLGIPPEHAQFLQTRQFSVNEIARLFLIPPHLIGSLERATFSNIEAQGQEYVTFCIEPWTRRIEAEINYKLFGTDRSHFAEHVLDGLLRGDSAARSAYYTAMLANGVLSVNEVRAMENRNAIEGGDVHRFPLNMAPLPTDTQEAA